MLAPDGVKHYQRSLRPVVLAASMKFEGLAGGFASRCTYEVLFGRFDLAALVQPHL